MTKKKLTAGLIQAGFVLRKMYKADINIVGMLNKLMTIRISSGIGLDSIVNRIEQLGVTFKPKVFVEKG